MGLGTNGQSKKSSEQTWKNFLSLWEMDAGALQATGVLNLEAFCRVLKDNNLMSEGDARDLYKFFLNKLGKDGLEFRVACWSNQKRSGRQPHFQIGYNPPREEQGSPSGGFGQAQASEPFRAANDDVPF